MGKSAPLPEIALTPPVGNKVEKPVSRDSEFHFVENAPQVPGRMLQDIELAVAEMAKTRGILKAIAQLLVEEGILSFEQIETRIAKLAEGEF